VNTPVFSLSVASALDIGLAGSLFLIIFDGLLLHPRGQLFHQWVLGESTMKVAPHSVSGRVVKTSIESSWTVLKTTEAPSLRPIQLVCRVRTRSGQSKLV